MDLRLKRIRDYALGMANIKISHHPLKKKVTIILNKTVRDVYQDSKTDEESRADKFVILRMDPDMRFVQDEFADELMEDSDKNPWIAIMTISDLLRVPKNDDLLIYKDENNAEHSYTITAVKPINREIPVVLECLLYPERSLV